MYCWPFEINLQAALPCKCNALLVCVCVSARKKKRAKTDTFRGNRWKSGSRWIVAGLAELLLFYAGNFWHYAFKKRQFWGTDSRRLRNSKSWPCDKNHRSVFILCDLHSNRRKLSEKTLTDSRHSCNSEVWSVALKYSAKNKKHFPSALLRINRSTSSFQSESIPFVGGLSLSTSQIKSS